MKKFDDAFREFARIVCIQVKLTNQLVDAIIDNLDQFNAIGICWLYLCR